MRFNVVNKDIYTPNKLFHYRDSLKRIANKEIISPTKLQIDLTNRCNNRCVWCFYDTHNLPEFSRNDYLKEHIVFNLLKSFKRMEGKGIEWVGGGEPTMHPCFLNVVKRAELLELRQILITNGKKLSGDIGRGVTNFDGVRISLDVASREMYKKQHGNDSFDLVVKNIENFAVIKNNNCVLGVSMVCDGVNYVEMVDMTRLAKEIGADNVRISLAYTTENEKIYGENWDKVNALMVESKKYEDDDFKVFTMNTRINNLSQKTGGGRCYCHHLSPSIGGNGVVYPCCHLKYLPEYNMGNLHENTFEEIWRGEKRKRFIETTGENCKVSCWMTDKNELADYIIKDPKDVPHLAFI